MIQQKYIFKKLADCYKRVEPQTLQRLENKGIKIGRGVIILPSDPSELFKRLKLHIESYNAGNKSLFNEINEIGMQLYRMKLLNLKQLKEILTNLK